MIYGPDHPPGPLHHSPPQNPPSPDRGGLLHIALSHVQASSSPIFDVPPSVPATASPPRWTRPSRGAGLQRRLIATRRTAPRPQSTSKNSPMTYQSRWTIAGRYRSSRKQRCTMRGRVRTPFAQVPAGRLVGRLGPVWGSCGIPARLPREQRLNHEMTC